MISGDIDDDNNDWIVLSDGYSSRPMTSEKPSETVSCISLRRGYIGAIAVLAASSFRTLDQKLFPTPRSPTTISRTGSSAPSWLWGVNIVRRSGVFAALCAATC